MQHVKLLMLVLTVCSLFACTDPDAVRYNDLLGTNGAFNAKSMVSDDLQIFYQVYLPEGMDANNRYPLVIHLHGDAYAANDNRSQINSPLVSVWHGGADFMQNEKTLIAVPQCPSGENWPNWYDEGDLGRFYGHLLNTYPVATDKIYLTGFDAGGTAVWKLLAQIPNRIAAAAIISATADVNDVLATPVASVPQMIFAAEDDTYVPYSSTLSFVDSLWSAGGLAGAPNDSVYEGLKFVRFPAADGLGHETETAATNYPDYIDFFLSKSL